MNSIRERLMAEEADLRAKLEAVKADLELLEGADAPGPVSYADFLKEDIRHEWLLESLIAAGTVNLFYSKGGLGKTTLVAQMALCAAAGRRFLAFDVPEPITVLLLEAEGSRAAFRERIWAAQRTLGIPEDVPVYVHPRGFNGWKVREGRIAPLIEKCRPRLVILDTLGYFYGGDENDAHEWKTKMMEPLRKMAGDLGCAFLTIHHASKPPAGAKSSNTHRGSSAMHDDADCVFRLTAEDEASTDRTFFIEKNKYGESRYGYRLAFQQRDAIFRATAS